jgi:serine/threonine protein phosphatase PrpC
VSRSFSFESAAQTDPGNVRKLNEDSMLDASPQGVWVVADGMGGHAAGDVASQTVVHAIAEIRRTGSARELIDNIDDAVEAANRQLYEQSLDSTGGAIMGTTLVVLVALPQHVVVCWAGDSRLYRLRDKEFEQLTRDHSQVEELVAAGQLAPEDAEAHPDANTITRAVGGESGIVLEYDVFPLETSDRFLLCSDGLYKELSPQEMGVKLSAGNVEQACKELMVASLAKKGRDNITVIVVEFDGSDASHSAG